MKNYVFVLGAADPEMQEIERVLTEHGYPFVYATRGMSGKRVLPVNAYSARHVSGSVPLHTHQVVFVECWVYGLRCDFVIDHHQEGDPGYDKLPHQYMEGSSLAQLLSLLNIEPTQEQRVICAADHCLTAAYRGECPGVSPEELAEFRIRTRSVNRNIPRELLLEQIEAARQLLVEAPRLEIEGVPVAWIAQADEIPELSEASARYNIPYMYHQRENPYSERMKAGILGASARVIRHWMSTCELTDVYGAPERGYAGGYYTPA
jgi:hypothetical protein